MGFQEIVSIFGNGPNMYMYVYKKMLNFHKFALFQAFMIAFSSNFIPRLVYMMHVNPDHTDEGFLQHSLAYFNTSDFQAPRVSTFSNVTVSCFMFLLSFCALLLLLIHLFTKFSL